MPLYEYTCLECGEEFEEMAPYSRADQMECSACGSHKTQRVASAFCSSSRPETSALPACNAGG